MISKTKDFQFNEETSFKNEIIHFFNIDALDSVLYIYLFTLVFLIKINLLIIIFFGKMEVDDNICEIRGKYINNK
jgi:hypothetical protein